MLLAGVVAERLLASNLQVAAPGQDTFQNTGRTLEAPRPNSTSCGTLNPSESVQDLLADARLTIEARRQAVVQAAAAQMVIVDTPTLSHMDWLNPAERAWMEQTSDRLANIADWLYAAQAYPNNDEIVDWMCENADELSLWHYTRTRTPDLPSLSASHCPTDFLHPRDYASSVNWFPNRPNYSAMFPSDFSEEELAYLIRTYPKSHPARLPYTVIERATEADIRALAAGPLPGPQGQETTWLVQGPEGKSYKVTHIRFHPRFARYFTEFAATLEKGIDQEVEGTKLHPEFQTYLREMARCLREGDFDSLLKADLQQSQGNLFLTFFPHEGYWKDGMKFPWMFEVGIRDREAIQKLKENGYVFAALEAEAKGIAEQLGAPVPDTEFDTSNIEQMVQIVWVYRNGGYLRCFPHGEPAGHDYPKVCPEGVTAHRFVVIADAIHADIDILKGLAEEFLPPEDAAMVSFEALRESVLWHEGSHALLGNRPETETTNRSTMATVYGDLWGHLAEPQSDTAFAKAHQILLSDGSIDPNLVAATLRTQFVRLLKKFVLKAAVLDPNFDDPHTFGANQTLGHLLQEGIARLREDGKFDVDWERFAQFNRTLWRELLTYGFQDSPEPYRQQARAHIEAIPNAIQERIPEGQRRRLRRLLLNRGHLEPPPLPSTRRPESRQPSPTPPASGTAAGVQRLLAKVVGRKSNP